MQIAIGADHAGYQLKDSLKTLLDEARAREIVKTFLENRFEGGRHTARVGKLEAH